MPRAYRAESVHILVVAIPLICIIYATTPHDAHAQVATLDNFSQVHRVSIVPGQSARVTHVL